jgi:hypothetical protein
LILDPPQQQQQQQDPDAQVDGLEYEEEEQDGFKMSDATAHSSIPLNTAQLVAQIPKDLASASVPPDISHVMDAMRKIMASQGDELATLREADAKRKAIAKAEAEKYAAQREPLANDVLAQMERIAQEEGVPKLSDAWRSTTKEMLVANGPIGMEHQAATVACMRKMSRQDEELATLKARNLELETAASELHKMTSVDESERLERRELKAGRRNAGASIMQPTGDDTEEAAPRGLESHPGWMQTMMARSGYSDRPNKLVSEFIGVPQQQTTARGVAAGRAPARQAAAPSPAAIAQPPAQQQRSVNAGRTQPQQQQQAPQHRQRMPATGADNRMDILSPQFYEHAQSMRQHASITSGNMFHMAGQMIPPPGYISWGNN